MDIKFDKIIACLDMAGCPNRCKHCWLGHLPNGNMSNDDLQYVANSFKPFTENLLVSSWFREPDYKNNYKELWDFENKLSTKGLPVRFELLSFWRIVRDEDYVGWAYNLGVRKCQLTFFGMKENTDYHTGRKGAFNELLKATDILLKNNIAPRWQVFVNKNNIADMDDLLKLSDELKLPQRCREIGQEFQMFVHQGSCDGENEKLYDVRITQDDIKNIPVQLLDYTFEHHGNKNICEIFGLPESELYKKLLSNNTTTNLVSTAPAFYISNNFDVYPNETQISSWWHLGNLKSEGVERVISNYLQNASLAQKTSLTIPVSEIVKTVGDCTSQRLFTKGDYITYILNKYCKYIINSAI